MSDDMKHIILANTNVKLYSWPLTFRKVVRQHIWGEVVVFSADPLWRKVKYRKYRTDVAIFWNTDNKYRTDLKKYRPAYRETDIDLKYRHRPVTTSTSSCSFPSSSLKHLSLNDVYFQAVVSSYYISVVDLILLLCLMTVDYRKIY